MLPLAIIVRGDTAAVEWCRRGDVLQEIRTHPGRLVKRHDALLRLSEIEGRFVTSQQKYAVQKSAAVQRRRTPPRQR
jgi:hypothetical protein